MKKAHLFIGLLASVFTLTAQETTVENEFLFVAHRGASYLAPENTLASIQLAWELGADAAECDVMLTKDNQVVLFHDKNTKKLTGVSHDIGETDWEQLRELTIGHKDSHLEKYKNENIPLLREVLAVVPGNRMLVIEIKSGAEIIPYLKKVVDAHWNSGTISFIAFDLEMILAMKKQYPEVPCYYLSSFGADVKKHFNTIVENGLDGLDLRHPIINRELVDKCKTAGLDLWCWTVNDPVIALKMKELGVSAVTTDRPAWLRESL